MSLYLAVSEDEYELPIAVARSAQELERLLGLGKGTVSSHISHAKSRRRKRQRYFKIEYGLEEEGD